MKIEIVQGGQYGSEAKGMVTFQKAAQAQAVTRTGSINAGHTVYYMDKKYVFQQLPVGALIPGKSVYIGPGAYVHLPTLERELDMVGGDIRNRLLVDYRASIHRDQHMANATSADRHTLIGTTGKGCSEVAIDRIANRSAGGAVTVGMVKCEFGVGDVPSTICRRHGYETVLLEGTQGAELDLMLGPYPYTTARMTSSAAWMAELGISPSGRNVETTLVFRTYPIRVAGNSGPMERETSWYELACQINRKLAAMRRPPLVSIGALSAWQGAIIQVSEKWEGFNGLNAHLYQGMDRERYAAALSNVHRDAFELLGEKDQTELMKLFELTTVTKKLRRIAKFDYEQFMRVMERENPAEVVFTFMNYLDPTKNGSGARWAKRMANMGNFKTIGLSYTPYGYTKYDLNTL